jgi:hypothetical protein
MRKEPPLGWEAPRDFFAFAACLWRKAVERRRNRGFSAPVSVKAAKRAALTFFLDLGYFKYLKSRWSVANTEADEGKKRNQWKEVEGACAG